MWRTLPICTIFYSYSHTLAPQITPETCYDKENALKGYMMQWNRNHKWELYIRSYLGSIVPNRSPMLILHLLCDSGVQITTLGITIPNIHSITMASKLGSTILHYAHYIAATSLENRKVQFTAYGGINAIATLITHSPHTQFG